MTTDSQPVSKQLAWISSQDSDDLWKKDYHAKVTATTTHPTTNVDLSEASLEDLEDLIAASAKRLASYKLRHQALMTDKGDDEEERRPNKSSTVSHKVNASLSDFTASTTKVKRKSSPIISSTRSEVSSNPTTKLQSGLSSSTPNLHGSTQLSERKKKHTATKPHKLSTVSTTKDQKQRVQQQQKTNKKQDVMELNQVKNSKKSASNNVTRTPTSQSNTSSTSTKGEIKRAEVQPKKMATEKTRIQRKRGKTLPGGLVTPIKPLHLPPLKIEPLDKKPKTPTRIPLPVTRPTQSNNSNGGDAIKRKSTAATSTLSSSRNNTVKKSNPTISTTTSSSTIAAIATKKQPTLQTSRSHKPEDLLTRQRKQSITNRTKSIRLEGSNSTNTAYQKKKSSSSTIHERLQGMVDESKSWPGHKERQRVVEGQTSEIVLRGKGSREEPKTIIRVAMSPQAALKLYQFNLTEYEKKEIMNYNQIYFTGHHSQKRPADPSHPVCNFGYDDERGDYLIQLKDHLDYRYEVIKVMGKGSFGQVLRCFDHHTGKTVAVKIIRNKRQFHAQALVEVKILQDLLEWDPDDKYNNVRMQEKFEFRNHLCIVFECLNINLYEYIKSNGFKGSSMGLVKRFAVQLLNSLALLRQHKLIHCDLKPENILLKHPTKSAIKVIDFGSSCLENQKVYSYIQSRFYRSPEVILGLSYSMAIDMWSLGCILAEIYTGYPLFPGENEQDQFATIMEIQGIPDKTLLEKSTRKKLFFDSNGEVRILTNKKGVRRIPGTKSLEAALKYPERSFLEFIKQCLCWDPQKRLSPDSALDHPWLHSMNRPS